MPTYEYVCQACGHEMELFQSMTAKPVRKCPACGKLKLKRKIGIGAGVIFKGSGFYETDYRSESYKKGQKAESEAGKKKDEKKSSEGGKKSEAKGGAGGEAKKAEKPAKKKSTD